MIMTRRLPPLETLDPAAGLEVEALSNHPIFDELFAEIIGERPSTATSNAVATPIDIPTLRRRKRPRLIPVGTAAAILLAILLALTLSGGGVTGPTTSAWRVARPLPPASRFASTGLPSGLWQLVGAIVPRGWQLDTAGPAPGYLTCPSTVACYVTGNGATSDSGPADFDSLYFSGDGGTKWFVLPLPSGFSFTTPLTCARSQTCAAGGTRGGKPVLVATANGGHQWTITPLSTTGELVELTCLSATTCDGVTAPSSVVSAIANGEPLRQGDEAFVQTTDGGATWTRNPLPADNAVSSLACPTATHCIMLGYPIIARQGPQVSGFARVTIDAGTTWTAGVLPPNFGFLDYSSDLSCGDATRCMAIGLTLGTVPRECAGTNGPDGSFIHSCSPSSRTIVSGVITTADGGLTWERKSLPGDVPAPGLSDVSCAAGSLCWAAGQEAVPQQTGNGVNSVSSVVLGTIDGGASWTRTTFHALENAPNDRGGDAYMSIGDISCPSAYFCLGLGVVDQGSKSTPVYSFSESKH
jgi:hypothetical protein